MPLFLRLLVIPLVLTLPACGGSNSQPYVINPENAALAANEMSVTLTTTDLNVTLERDPDFDRGPFSGASDLNDDNEGMILGYSEGEATFAAFLVNQETETSADSFFGRIGEQSALPSGEATLEGTYIGTFTTGDQFISGRQIVGEAVLTVDLEAMTVRGDVTNQTIEIFDLPFVLSEELDVIFPEAEILPNGAFTSTGEHIVANTENSTETSVTTDWSGLVAGETLDDLEVVGRVDIVAITEGASNLSDLVGTTRQSGVFVVGHD